MNTLLPRQNQTIKAGGNIFLIAFVFCFSHLSVLRAQQLLINEIMISPPAMIDGSIADNFMGFSLKGEWIEFYNPSPCSSLDVSCYSIGTSYSGDFMKAAGYTFPSGTVIPPLGFLVVRGISAPAVPPNMLVGNGGKTVELIVQATDVRYTDAFDSTYAINYRFVLYNNGGWIGLYDDNGLPLDAVSWGAGYDIYGAGCKPASNCGGSGSTTLPGYNSFPTSNQTFLTSAIVVNSNKTYMRIPDGGPWSLNTEYFAKMGDCNSVCNPSGGNLSVSPSTAAVCFGDSVKLTASGSGSYTWSPATGLSSTTGSSVVAKPEASVTYTVTGSNGGCNGTATVTVNVTPLSVTANPHDTAVCAGSMVQLIAGGGANYSWSPSTGLTNANIANPVAMPLTSVTYTVTVSSGACSGTSTVAINVFPALPTPTITQSKDTLFCSIDPKYTSYQWYSNSAPIQGATNSFYVAAQSGNYNVAVSDENRCSVSVGINIVLSVSPNNFSSDNEVSLFPNPANDLLTIESSILRNEESLIIIVSDMLGKKVISCSPKPMKEQGKVSISIKSLSPGIYFLEAESPKGMCAIRFVKQ